MNRFEQSVCGLRTAERPSSLGGLRRLGRGLSLVFALAGATSGAFGGTGDKSLSVDVEKLPAAVSYSRSSLDQQTFAAYKVTIKSLVKNGLNNVWFKATGSSTIKQFSDGYGCAVDDLSVNTALTCKLGAIAFGMPKAFVIVLNVPDAAAPACVNTSVGAQCIQFNWQVANGQGNANDQPSDSQFSQKRLVETPVSDDTAAGNTSRVASYIIAGTEPDPSTVTGVLSTQLADAKAKTTVKVPKDSPVFIEQTETSATRGSCQNIYILCFLTELRIEENGAATQFGDIESTGLAISLYRDVSTLKNANTSIDKAVLRYGVNKNSLTDIQACVSRLITVGEEQVLVPALPDGQVNCIIRRELDGTRWRFDLLASRNGFREF